MVIFAVLMRLVVLSDLLLQLYSFHDTQNTPMIDTTWFEISSTIDIEFKNYALHLHEQTALMQACQYGHWEVVQTLVLFKANV